MTYALALSEDEQTRYRLMAEMARSDEGGYLIASGLRPGAAVADEDDVARWDAAFTRVDAESVRPWGSVPICIAVGQQRGAR